MFVINSPVCVTPRSQVIYLLSWLVPWRTPLLVPGDTLSCTRPWPHCCSWSSYQQSCQERQREPRMKGGRKRGCGGREGAVEGRALPRLSLLQLCKNRILPHSAAQIYRVKVNSHEFEERLKISSHCLTVLDENSMDQRVKHSKYSSLLYACSVCCSKITHRHITDTYL